MTRKVIKSKGEIEAGAKVASALNEVNNQKKVLEEVHGKIKEAEKLLDSKNCELSALIDVKNELQRTVENLNKQVEEFSAKRNEALKKLEEDSSRCKNEAQGIVTELGTLEARLTHVNSEANETRLRNEALKAEILALTQNKEAIQAEMDNSIKLHEKSLGNLSQMISKKLSALEELERMESKIHDEVIKNQNTIHELENEKLNKDGEIASKKNEIVLLDSEKSRILSEIAKANTDYDKVKQEIQNAQEALLVLMAKEPRMKEAAEKITELYGKVGIDIKL